MVELSHFRMSGTYTVSNALAGYSIQGLAIHQQSLKNLFVVG